MQESSISSVHSVSLNYSKKYISPELRTEKTCVLVNVGTSSFPPGGNTDAADVGIYIIIIITFFFVL